MKMDKLTRCYGKISIIWYSGSSPVNANKYRVEIKSTIDNEQLIRLFLAQDTSEEDCYLLLEASVEETTTRFAIYMRLVGQKTSKERTGAYLTFNSNRKPASDR